LAPRLATLLLACGATLAAVGTAHAGGPETPLDAPGRYQVFFGAPQAGERSAMAGQWRSIDLETQMLSGGPVDHDAGAIGYSGPAGMAYFTPRLTGIGLGIGLTGKARQSTAAGDFPHGATPGRDGRNWHLGGSVGTSSLRIGATFGDHVDPACRDTEACNTNDFWDIGLAWRFGSGALSAGYTASQRRTTGDEDPETLGIFSINAGYRIAPGLDVFGGVDWIELPTAEAPQDQPRNTRFMLGTNLRF
jgi:hypothetical protein